MYCNYFKVTVCVCVGIFLSEWSAGDHSIDKRQIVLQQVINTLTILFKAQNNLCFWGSFQIWIDSNYRVFLYVDFIKSLAIQKVGCIKNYVS